MTNKKHTGDLSEYDESFLRCRGLRNHTWKFQTDYNVATGPRGRIIEFTRTLHCMGCSTDREDTFTVTKTGRFIRQGHPVYRYADGYTVSRGNPIKTDEARDALMVREMQDQLEATLLNRLLSMRPEAQVQARLRVVGE